MSKVRKPMFTSANNSTHNWGSSHQRRSSATMLLPQLRSVRLQLHHFLQHGIVAMPLDEIGTAHKRAVLAGASVVMPQIEIGEVYGLRKRRPAQHAIFPKAIHQIFGLGNARVRVQHDLSAWVYTRSIRAG